MRQMNYTIHSGGEVVDSGFIQVDEGYVPPPSRRKPSSPFGEQCWAYFKGGKLVDEGTIKVEPYYLGPQPHS